VDTTDVTVDCTDLKNLPRFWSVLLQRPFGGRKGPYVWLARCTDCIGLGFHRADTPERSKNRVQIDITGQDLLTIKQRVESLRGARVDGYEDGGFLVLADPEGNEFCAVPEVLTIGESERALSARDSSTSGDLGDPEGD
jgi:hypothetical protein